MRIQKGTDTEDLVVGEHTRTRRSKKRNIMKSDGFYKLMYLHIFSSTSFIHGTPDYTIKITSLGSYIVLRTTYYPGLIYKTSYLFT